MSVEIPEAAFRGMLTAFATLGAIRRCTLGAHTFNAIRTGPQATPGNVEALGTHDGARFTLRFLKSDSGFADTDAPEMPTAARIMVQDGEGAIVRPYRIVSWECGAVTIRAGCGEALQ